MDRTPVRLITISREFGAGGSTLGRRLHERLGWRLLGRDLITRVAARLDCPATDVEAADEHCPGFAERVAAIFAVTPADAPVVPDPLTPAYPDRVAELMRAILLEAAKAPPLIVVGHGGQCLFGQRPDAFHVRVVAPFAQRVRTVMAETGWSERIATEAVRRRDTDWPQYLRRHYRADPNDPHLYAFVANTGVVAIESVAEMVLTLTGAASAQPA